MAQCKSPPSILKCDYDYCENNNHYYISIYLLLSLQNTHNKDIHLSLSGCLKVCFDDTHSPPFLKMEGGENIIIFAEHSKRGST